MRRHRLSSGLRQRWAWVMPYRQCLAQALADQHQPQTTAQLDQSQQGGAAQIVVVTQRLVDRQFDGGGLRSAAQRQHGGEAGETQHEDQRAARQDLAAQRRPFDEAELLPAAHTQLGGQLALLHRNVLQRLQQQAGGQWQVKEQVRQQNALQPVGREAIFDAQPAAQRRQPALAPIDAEQAEHRHQHRQHQRHGAQPQQQLPAGETAAIERARQQNGGQHRNQR